MSDGGYVNWATKADMVGAIANSSSWEELKAIARIYGLKCQVDGCSFKRCTAINSPLCWPHTVAIIASRGLAQSEVESTLNALIDLVNGKP